MNLSIPRSSRQTPIFSATVDGDPIRMPVDLWSSMIRNIQTHGKADLEYTLNSLDLSQSDGIAYSPVDDQYRQDLFYRYNQNFQDFFDASARVQTSV